MIVFDAHIHNKHQEQGGFLIGLEGKPLFEGVLNNQEALALHDPASGYCSFYYVTKENIREIINHPYLKYHPRREKYSPDEVIMSIKDNKPKGIIIDTLNEPFWIPYDYWKIARSFPDIPMIFAHSGGYLINDFVKICHFQKNVWIDFSLTHTTLGKLGDNTKGLPYINQAIQYALNSSFKHKVLLGSDYPFFNQESVFDYYSAYISILNENYLSCLKEFDKNDSGAK